MSSKTRVLPVDQIVVAPAIQPRVGGLDAEHIRVLMEAPEAWPPLLVAEREGRYILVDGFHRYRAAIDLGLADIRIDANVSEGADLREVAFQANARHGRALSLRDRRRHAEYLLGIDPLVSNHAISGRAGLSPSTVAKIRQDLEAASAIPATQHQPGHSSRVMALERRPGELPDQGLTSVVGEGISGLLTSVNRTHQRHVARYLQRLVVPLAEHTEAFADFGTPEEVAEACIAILGEERSERIAAVLGYSTYNLALVAQALGYRPDPEG